MLRVLAIGDPHVRVENLDDINSLIQSLSRVVEELQPDVIVVLGDILHSHERVYTLAMNKALEMLNLLRRYAPTYALVGNHDYIQNQQFLTSNHWMTALHEWDSLVVVDKVVSVSINGRRLTFVPYTPDGLFRSALDTCPEWEQSDMIFAHQEFVGCKKGRVISTSDDIWDESDPFVVSGHIHERQRLQNNIYYPGTPLQHGFSERGDNTVALLSLSETSSEPSIREISLGLPVKHSISLSIDEFESFVLPAKSDRRYLRMEIKGDKAGFLAVRHSQKYLELTNDGCKVVFCAIRAPRLVEVVEPNLDIRTVLDSLISGEDEGDAVMIRELIEEVCPELKV